MTFLTFLILPINSSLLSLQVYVNVDEIGSRHRNRYEGIGRLNQAQDQVLQDDWA